MLEKFTYTDGYRSGQHDALTWLVVDAADDATLAAFDEQVQFRAAMICLGRNLGMAAMLLRAHLLGHERGLFRPSGNDPREVIDEYIRSTFRPGHALSTKAVKP